MAQLFSIGFADDSVADEMSTLSAKTRPRLLYLMHVDWDWIKQRPQFIAEELSRAGFDVLVCYLPTVHRRRLSSNPSPIRRLPLVVLPMRQVRAVRKVNRHLARSYLSVVSAAWKPDAVLVTHPDLYDLLPRRMASLPLFYDCMDLAVGFASNKKHRRSLADAEGALLAHATLVFVSSEGLRRAIRELGFPERRVVLVRNGHPNLVPSVVCRPFLVKATADLAYAGTISDWVDLAPLIAALEALPRLRVHLWGPAIVRIPCHERLVWHGVVARHELDAATAFVDAFVLPFRLGELIAAVDPVKMYEYVAWGRPIVAVYYPELDQFAPFVHFYNTAGELLALLQDLLKGRLTPPGSSSDVSSFLHASTWEARASVMAAEMKAALP